MPVPAGIAFGRRGGLGWFGRRIAFRCEFLPIGDRGIDHLTVDGSLVAVHGVRIRSVYGVDGWGRRAGRGVGRSSQACRGDL